ncbi:MAG TPA: hypothetical protein VF522_01615 [Ramlibacter sp.]|uniref:hypothetical protein n=1 Tax=Ramlibacter sp. TaxID=1917967 RepID=UPI002ED289AB
MRIELPPASWADTAQRAEDDAHTLTVAAPAAADWVQWQWPTGPEETLRVEVPGEQPRRLTLTF